MPASISSVPKCANKPRTPVDQTDVEDCCGLEPLTEESLVLNLLSRFQRDQIYSYAGNVLVSVNPYKPLAQYSSLVIESYKMRTALSWPELPPHVYSVADSAWRSLRDGQTSGDQVVLITGESGSGKTEASKLILQYLAAAAGRSKDLESIRHQLLLCNPVLEAFGNAKTIHNDNASRFGKYFELEFDFRGEPCGGHIHHYALEKSRVTNRNQGERNFHIFYQLLAGAEVQLLKSLKLLRNTDNYNLLNESGLCGSPPTSSGQLQHGDKEEFLNTKRALESVGFSADEVTDIFRLVAAVLKLGNLVFSPLNHIDGTEGCSITNEYELEEVAMLLLTPAEDLRSALLYRVSSGSSDHPAGSSRPSLIGNNACSHHHSAGFTSSRESTLTFVRERVLSHHPDASSLCGNSAPPSGIQQRHQRASVVSNTASLTGREVYPVMMDGCYSDLGSNRICTHYPDKSDLIEIEADLSAAEATAGRDALCRAIYSRLFTWIVNSINERIKVKQSGKKRVLGLLDIYGFEDLSVNGFEQLLINYLNEKLHQASLQVLLKEEQEEYIQEGLEWTLIPFQDNLPLCDLIEKNSLGILSILDDECHKPMDHHGGSDETFLIRIGQLDHTVLDVRADAFRLQHYAGPVTYKVTGIVEKNRDVLVRSLSHCMYNCGHPILKELFPEGNPRRTTLRRPASAATQFKVALSALLRSVVAKNPHFVRCIRPNSFKTPHHFDAELVHHQIRYLGLVESIRVRKGGYVFRQSYSCFLQRYKMLSPVTWPHWSSMSIEGVARLLRDLPISATEYAFGRRKLLIKSSTTVMQLEEFRRKRLHELAELIQKTFRGWSARRFFLRRKECAIRIVRAWKQYKANIPLRRTRFRLSSVARKEFLELRQRRLMVEAVDVIQRAYVTHKRKKYLSRLAGRLPSASPTCRDWPSVSPCLRDTNQLLKKIYHVWRCHRYRLSFDQIGRNRMREKVTASFLFRNRKESYSRSVAHPFGGDYVRLRHNSQWRKIVTDTVDHFIVFADIVSKITRSSGRLVPVLFVVTTSSLLILDQRTLSIKYRVPAADVVRISLSPFIDDIAVFHIKTGRSEFDCSTASVHNLHSGCLQFHHTNTHQDPLCNIAASSNKWKGDLILQTCHVIELVTKIFLVVQNAASKAPEINIHTDFETNVGHHTVEVSFRCLSLPDVQPGHVRIIRRGHRLEVTL